MKIIAILICALIGSSLETSPVRVFVHNYLNGDREKTYQTSLTDDILIFLDLWRSPHSETGKGKCFNKFIEGTLNLWACSHLITPTL